MGGRGRGGGVSKEEGGGKEGRGGGYKVSQANLPDLPDWELSTTMRQTGGQTKPYTTTPSVENLSNYNINTGVNAC